MDVYSLSEIARAAGTTVREVAGLVDDGQVATIDAWFVTEAEAARAVRLLTGAHGEPYRQRAILAPQRSARTAALPFAASTALHVGVVGLIALLTAFGLKDTTTEAKAPVEPARLVFIATPGPGGGGGGGGLRRPDPPARAETRGRRALRSPVRTEARRRPASVERQTPPRRPEPKPAERPPDVPAVQPEQPPVPPIVAPVAAVPADARDQAGVPDAPPPAPPSNGPGTGGGAGTGSGTGIGEGNGSGVGAGEGGGTGGGPYRPGSGITPPGLLREVKPQYTEEARRLGVEGDVVLEIVVRTDGSVGDVTLLRRLGSGLDQRAIEAVRQWRFSPARRFGTPVDVLVEVAVEFKLR